VAKLYMIRLKLNLLLKWKNLSSLVRTYRYQFLIS
jgi:hypothetical protein